MIKKTRLFVLVVLFIVMDYLRANIKFIPQLQQTTNNILK